jgi:hypothetical protein
MAASWTLGYLVESLKSCVTHSASTSAVHSCGGLGSYVSQDLGYITDITSRNINCQAARLVVRLEAKTGSKKPGEGWTCNSWADPGPEQGNVTIRCTHAHNLAVRFHAGG